MDKKGRILLTSFEFLLAIINLPGVINGRPMSILAFFICAGFGILIWNDK